MQKLNFVVLVFCSFAACVTYLKSVIGAEFTTRSGKIELHLKVTVNVVYQFSSQVFKQIRL